MRRRNYSRLSSKIDTQSKKTFILSILGIILLLSFMIWIGIPLLANFTGFISGFNSKNNESVDKEASFITPPVLDSIIEATNNSELKVSGQASRDQEITLYLNNAMLQKKPVNNDGTFTFTLFLHQGNNKIKVQAIEGDKKSEFSEEQSIKLLTKNPSLEISSPTDGQVFNQESSQIEIKGTTDDNAQVTINGFWATSRGTSFIYKLNLQNGENTIKIIAEDEAGNKTEKEIKVTYSP